MFLHPGTPYWFVLEPKIFGVANETYNADYSIASSILQPYAGVSVREILYGQSDWSDWTFYANDPPPVFRLDGVAVPEPGTWALLTLGSALFWCAARRRKAKAH